MATVAQSIGEVDVVELTRAIGEWPVGTTGTVVHDFGEMKMVEISNDRGESLDFPLVPAKHLKLVSKHSD